MDTVVELTERTGACAMGLSVRLGAIFADGRAGGATRSNDWAHWTIGGGVEWAFAGNWTVKGEYMFIGLDNDSACGLGTNNALVPARSFCWNHSGLNGVSTAKIGLNYLFGGGVPVVARY